MGEMAIRTKRGDRINFRQTLQSCQHVISADSAGDRHNITHEVIKRSFCALRYIPLVLARITDTVFRSDN